MGLFNRKPKTPPGPPTLEGTTPWRLRGHGRVPLVVSDEWAQTIRDSTERVPRVGHSVTVELKRDSQGNVGVFHRGALIGWLDAQTSRDYASAFAALEKTGRHGLVDAVVEPTSFKSGGATWINLVQPAHYPAVPFNQPPEGYERAGAVDCEVKDENKYAGFIRQISRGMNASPGFFLIWPPDEDGVCRVYAPVDGKDLGACQVGVINKAGTARAKKATANGPVYAPGIVWLRATTPQIELASWYG